MMACVASDKKNAYHVGCYIFQRGFLRGGGGSPRTVGAAELTGCWLFGSLRSTLRAAPLGRSGR